MTLILTPPYRRLIQQPMLCAAASVQMVLFRHGHWFDQEEIAQALGVVVRENQATYYGRSFPTADDTDLSRLGVRLIGIDQKLNDFFREKHLSFTAKIIRTSKIADYSSFLTDELAHNHDVIVNFWVLQEVPRTGMGHFALIASVTDRKIEFCDPYPQHPPLWSIEIPTLIERMGDRWDGKERGLVVIAPVETQPKEDTYANR